MSTDFEKIKEIARASLMPDFFAVRIDEEGLWTKLQQLVSKIQTPTPNPSIERIKQVTREAPTCDGLIAKMKEEDLWMTLKELITRVRLK